jgi:hypothetical protein
MSDPVDLERAERDAETEAGAATDAEAEAAAEGAGAAAADAAVDHAAPLESDEVVEPLTANDYTVAFSPKQVAVGLAIVAGLVALVAARRRGRSGRGDG